MSRYGARYGVARYGGADETAAEPVSSTPTFRMSDASKIRAHTNTILRGGVFLALLAFLFGSGR